MWCIKINCPLTLLGLGLLLCLAQHASAQQDSSAVPLSNWRFKTLPLNGDTLVLDERAVFPNSVRVTGVPDSAYAVQANRLIFAQRPADSLLQVRYRVLPYDLAEHQQHKDRSLIGRQMQHDRVIGSGYTYNPFTTNTDAFNFSDLDYSGTFARGLSVGNSQDLILNSTFNLQVGGKLGDVEILGAISDNNVPLQPEGNTQQLDEFDRIFVQFKYKGQRLIAGDYNLERPANGYFVNYFRRLQGGQLFTNLKMGKGHLKTDGSVAVSRGKFARMQFDGQEGNQGPYRLRGANGEVFVIVLAGTERVYIDGQLMSRGADQDYTIDYNLGEITFTPQRLITKDLRIQVEFSYTDLTFLRTLMTANTSYETDRLRVRFNLYSEQDAKGQTVTEALSDSAKAVLRRVGDATDQAFISGITIPDQTGEATGTIFYKLVDTLANGVLYEDVLVYATDTSAIYSARFSSIASGGNYVRSQGAANGIVYRWVAPDPLTGQPLGTHEPVRLIDAPQQRQLYNVGADLQLGQRGTLSADVALSHVDQNTFSDIGNEDNQGIAARLTYAHQIPLSFATDTTGGLADSLPVQTALDLDAHYEYLSATFAFIEPYRPREFARDWNITSSQAAQEQLFRVGATLSDQRWGSLGYRLNGLYRDSSYSGLLHALEANVRQGGFQVLSNSTLLHSQTEEHRTTFARPRLDLSYRVADWLNWRIGVYGELEQNSQVNLATDTLMRGSLFYHLYRVYTELPASDELSLQASYTRRHDYTPLPDVFALNSQADAVQIGGTWNASKASRLQWNMTYRNLQIVDSTLTTQVPRETYLGRLEYLLQLQRGFIRSNTIYQLGSGQQQKVDYNYVKVDQGQGAYVWIDRNEDQVQQVDEFELSPFPDQADYIRVTLLTGQFIRTNNVLFTQSLAIHPKILIQNIRRKKNISTALPIGLDFLQRFSTRSIFKIDRKTFDGATNVVAFNPFQLAVDDSSLVAISSSITNTLYFNRTGTYSFEVVQRDSRSKTLLSTGFESRRLSQYTLRQRLNLRPKGRTGKEPSPFWRQARLQAALEATWSEQGNDSEFFPIRDYTITTYQVAPQLTFLYQKAFRTVLEYEYASKQNELGDEEYLLSHNITAEVSYNQASKTNIKGSFSIVQVSFNGDPNSPVGYTMTEGLRAGANYLWTLSWSQALTRSLQLTLGYEGRRTGEDSPVVHVGRAEIRATF